MIRQSGIPAAIMFYTCLPLPSGWIGNFQTVARLAPLVGVLIGGVLGALDQGLQWLEMPVLTRSAVVAIVWLGITGGLHLDGAMDTADGLAVSSPAASEERLQHRLRVMSDSATGAFGAMAAIVLLLLKTTALTDLSHWRWLALMVTAGWGRWGQQVAILEYPYLKPEGKGAFHKSAIRSPVDLLPGLLLLLGLSAAPVLIKFNVLFSAALAAGGSTIAVATAAWFHRQLGGHTGDTYGAVVEWTEALLLTLLTLV